MLPNLGSVPEGRSGEEEAQGHVLGNGFCISAGLSLQSSCASRCTGEKRQSRDSE